MSIGGVTEWGATAKGISYLVDHGCFGPPTEKKEWPPIAAEILLELADHQIPIPARLIASNIRRKDAPTSSSAAFSEASRRL